MFNTSELILHWENKSPVTFAPELHLTEYVLLNMWTNETTVNADLSDLRHGAFGKLFKERFSVQNFNVFHFQLVTTVRSALQCIYLVKWVSI